MLKICGAMTLLSHCIMTHVRVVKMMDDDECYPLDKFTLFNVTIGRFMINVKL